ncbi:MAG TPA: FtsX-like permease family protein, partial [Actinomycetota bacterium]|nr:FtsX-like permease family protein [Actinomycetota bacterium]
SAANAKQIGQRCAATVGFALATGDTLSGRIGERDAPGARGLAATALLERRDAAVERAGSQVPGLGAPLLTIIGAPLVMSNPADQRRYANGRLLYREGFTDHIQKLQVAGGSGVWLPSETAAFAGVRAGGRVALVQGGRRVVARVAGIYKDLNRLPVTPFWCAKGPLIYAPGLGREIPPPPILADRATMADLNRQLREDHLIFSWELPLRGDLTLPQSQRTVGSLDRLRAALGTGPGALFLLPGQALFASQPGVLRVGSELPFVVQRSRGIVAAVRGAIGPVSTAGLAVALLLAAAAGSYWVDRRRGEVALLAVKGVGPVAIALKAGLEMVLPAAAGALAGWGLAILLVRTFGPSDLLDASAPWSALARAGMALAGGVALLGAVAALRVRAQTERGIGVRPGWIGRVPFELAVLALAALAFQRLQAHRPPVASGTTVPRIDLLLLAFPLLFLTGTVGLGVRALGVATRRLRTAGERWPHAVYLAARRLSSSSRLALLLLAAAAMSIGVLVYAATLTLSVRTTLDAKARVFLGSDVSMLLQDEVAPPPGLRATTVARLDRVDVGGERVDVLAIDPATFERAAFWDSSFASRPLGSLLAALSPAGAGQPAPALALGRFPTQGAISFTKLTGKAVRVPYQVVGQVRTFPGSVRGNPTLVVDRRALGDLSGLAEYRLWARGDLTAVQAAVQRAGIATGITAVADNVLDVTSFLAVSWTFGFLQSFGVLTGLITIGGLLLYLETRQRARKVTYVLIRRMGLSRAAHRLSVLVEVGATMVLGCALGMALSLVAARLVYPRLDALPEVAPTPLLRTPVAALLATGSAALLATWLGAWTAQRSADRTNAAEVMRLAE